MRYIAFTTLAVLALGLFNVGKAEAAWSCHGAEYVCSGSHSAKSVKKAQRQAYVSQKSGNKQAYRQASYKKQNKVARSNPVTSPGSYGGGSTGMASYYWQGQMTASGARFNPNAMTAAHRSLPFGTRVLVTNRSNGRSVTVTINDRGPFIKGRIIDLSSAAAGVIGMKGAGVAPVSISVLGRG